ncbi:MAG TPA: SOS response-associated peptidase [Dermatophilaceae bacterium]|nr:SOS response-associated peptidase [Dermatophilaceae bacterium]
MCGRYAATANPDDLVEEFEIDQERLGEPVRSLLAAPQVPPAGAPDFNMAPTKAAPVVLARRPRGQDDAPPARQLRLMSWGLVPSWAKDVKVGLKMINARAETVLDKFAKPALSRRCLVPAQGWYEWQPSPTALDAKGRPRRQPFFVHRADGATMGMAGLYEFWRDPAVRDADDPDAWVVSFTVITTDAEPGLDRIHDRQPLVLEPQAWAQWLDPDEQDPDVVRRHLAFAQPGRFDAYPVSSAVNSSRNNGPQLLAPADRADLAGVVDPTTGEVLR